MSISAHHTATSRVIAIIPARNEEGTIGAVVRQVLALASMDVVVVDDKSTDATIEQALAAGARVLPLSCHLGAWGAAQTGFRYAVDRGYACGVTLDADGQHLPEAIPRILRGVQNGEADVVIGACPERVSTLRRLAWGYFRRLTGLLISDLTSGLRAYNLTAMRALLSFDAQLLEYQDVGVLLLLRRRELTIKEAPVCMTKRAVGHSRVFNTWGSVCAYLLKTSILCASKTRQDK